MADVFISYSREDAWIAFRMGRLLQQEGWSTWIDRQIRLGEDFRPDIEREIDRAACVLVIWTGTAVTSRWVREEASRALRQRKLVEVELSPGLAAEVALSEVEEERCAAILTGELVQTDPAGEQILARVAAVGRLTRPRDSWNATLLVHNWHDRAPSHPIIAWEWVVADERSRICRRERWVNSATSEYRTTIGNFWQFGYEGTRAAVGYLTITKPRHEVTLPRRNKRRERNADESAVPFTQGGTAGEIVSGFNYPGGGVALEREEIGVDAIENACRAYLQDESDPALSLLFVSNDTGDPSEFDVGIEMFVGPRVWCKLVATKRTRDRGRIERNVARLLELGWTPPPQGVTEGSRLLGRRLTEWWRDFAALPDLDFRALAQLILNTFVELSGAPPAGWSSGTSTATVPHASSTPPASR